MLVTDPKRALEINRRTFLEKSFAGIGSIALASIASQKVMADRAWPAYYKSGTPMAPRVKNIIHLCMAGGPSHMDTFDPKPELTKLNGKAFPESFTKGQQLAQLQGAKLIARGSISTFSHYGQSGLEFSDYFPHMGKIADDLCILRAMKTEQINHDPAHAFMNTGSIIKGRPCMGSWTLYGLGAETEELPGYVVLMSGGGQPVSSQQWSSGFLPSRYQGVQFQSKGDAVHYVGNPSGVCQSTQRQVIDEVKKLNGFKKETVIDRELEARISQYEMAFRMQTSVPELTDISEEPQSILDTYGIQEAGEGSFAANCLLARRLVERGVRFVQLYHRGWDHHSGIETKIPKQAKNVDQASAALIADLKQRGLLDQTLVIWGGEFGRTPMGQGSGRDHHINAFSLVLAGGGVKAGYIHGQTDELGYRGIEGITTVHDLHATMQHLCGIDPSAFTHKFQGLEFKLTGVEGHRVIDEIIA